MTLSIKNRIALNYIVATAIVIAIVFLIILLIIRTTVFYNLDKELTFEAQKHSKEIGFHNDSIKFVNIKEWTEREHTEVQIHPVFIQIVSKSGELMDKSPNLKDATLTFDKGKLYNEQFNVLIKERPLRQIQIPIEEQGEIKGYILAAISLEDAQMVINNLKKTLLILYPIVILGLFGVARYLAGRSIRPIKKITDTANHITRNNLNQRIDLPKNKDELYILTASINELLQRMQEALEREKQFTSDASHELRTPLTVLKGTLEVLNRKPRTEAEYKEKIAYSIEEINRLSLIVDQLLMLARFEETHKSIAKEQVSPVEVIDTILERHKEHIKKKALKASIHADDVTSINTDPYYIELILDNLISNAIKYSKIGKEIDVNFSASEAATTCTIKDEGIGIKSEDLPHIFNPFFRSESSLQFKEIKGNGLGLPIVKKACTQLGIDINYKSEPNKGTTVTLTFPEP